MIEEMLGYDETVSDMLEELAPLTMKGRNRLRETSFALPSRRYPIHDKVHARSALQRVAQHGTAKEMARVRRAVMEKYPSMEVEHASRWYDYVVKVPGVSGKHSKVGSRYVPRDRAIRKAVRELKAVAGPNG